MNLLDAIGTLINGGGLKDIVERVYSEHAVVHMMKGEVVQLPFL